MELYKAYRPKKLKEIVGNRPVLHSISNMLRAGTLPQVLLFTGPSGCGKTTLARIIQSNLGCSDLDKQELNSSSFRGIDSIRELQRVATLCPIGDSRVWILDEVHKMTSDAQSAALKLLEDTPPNVYFFLCTTNPEKLSKALRNRCTIFQVNSLTGKELGEVIWRVAKAEEMKISDDGVKLIADSSDGSARAALVLLDQLRGVPEDKWDSAIANNPYEVPGAIDLCRALMRGKKWNVIRECLNQITVDPETTRRIVLAYASTTLLKSGKMRAYEMIQCFATPFYDTGKAGLVASCWEVITGSE